MEDIYIVCGYTDMRKSIDGLAGFVQQNFKLDPFSNSLFMFCEKKCNRLNALYWEGDGFVILYKVLEGRRFQWPRTPDEIQKISRKEFHWLQEWLSIHQPKAVRKMYKTCVVKCRKTSYSLDFLTILCYTKTCKD